MPATPDNAAGGSSLVFVYGSLKRGEYNHWLIASSQFIGLATTDCEFRLFALSTYPAMVRWPAAPLAIEGELFRVDAVTLARLDYLEENGRLYQREEIAVAIADDGRREQAWTYLSLEPLPPERLHPSASWTGR
jgi:gamma-glutamylcyclotransferase (GGCT)/AIG2-like uncharacterized protein YtfP